MANEVEDAFMNGVALGIEKVAATTAQRVSQLAGLKGLRGKARRAAMVQLAKKNTSSASLPRERLTGRAQKSAAKAAKAGGLGERMRYMANRAGARASGLASRFGALSPAKKALYGGAAAAAAGGAAYGGYKLYKKMKARKAMREQAKG